ncbi:unnamed protein product [Oikopleura dioica]|uniref:VWFA domain-containing protein n=1 Tax=Oikopleura dioica TaxID=34765 RepID=E4XVZ7_OIKDI|nr:unnamed protein product [Oikopleura dioica]
MRSPFYFSITKLFREQKRIKNCNSYDRAIVPAAARSLRDKGVRIFAIGVGNAVESELKEIASEPYENHAIFIQGDFNAFQVEYNGRDYASFSFQNGDLVINREGAQDLIRGDLLPKLSDGNFHKIQVFFDELDVTVLVDCLQVGTLDLPTVQTAEQRSDFKLLSSGAGLVQDLAFIAGEAEAEECCELGPTALCPSRNERNAAPARLASSETAKIISSPRKIKSCRDCCKIEDLSSEFLNALKEKLREI